MRETNDEFRLLIERGDVEGVRRALSADASLANRTIHWYLNQPNKSDPLHFVSDCVCNGLLTDAVAANFAVVLLEHGAVVDGTEGRETPLIASASSGAPSVSKVLIHAGAQLENTSIFGARALHWAAWMGTTPTVDLLIAKGAAIELKCSEFGATPLFWAVHGYSPHGPKEKADQVGAARSLIKAGAKIETSNKHGLSALELAKSCAKNDLHGLLQAGRTA